jgi:uncharacterized membrane protein YgaE (UPF0421/DUF939 family)
VGTSVRDLPAAHLAAATASRLRTLGDRLGAIAQAALAAAISWYLTRDVIGYPQPFFAPVAAAVCLSASKVLRGERAIQLIIGVALGILVGEAVRAVAGTGAVALGLAVLVSLSLAVLVGAGFIAQGLMFFNQAVSAAILVLAVPSRGAGPDRLLDALIGGGVGLVFAVLLFPTNPLRLLDEADASVLAVLHDLLGELDRRMAGVGRAGPGWQAPAVDRLLPELASLAQSRTTAQWEVRISPLRWPARAAVQAADRRAAQVVLVANAALELVRVADHAIAANAGPRLGPARAACQDLAAATAALARPEAAARAAAAASAAASAARAAELEADRPAALAALAALLADDCAAAISELAGQVRPGQAGRTGAPGPARPTAPPPPRS